MGHDTHFLERLERVNPEHQALALRLYREPVETRRILNILCQDVGLLDERDRIAIALEDGGEGPYIIVTRGGRFVTCLAKGMKVDGMYVIPRGLIDAHSAWSEAARAVQLSEELDHVVALMDVVRSGSLPSRAVFEELSLFIGLFAPELVHDIDKFHHLYEDSTAAIIAAPRQLRRAVVYGTEQGRLLGSWSKTRRSLMHTCVAVAMGVRLGPPVAMHPMEHRVITLIAWWIASHRSPAALLRACWMLIQRVTISAQELVDEIRTSLYHEDGLLYLPTLFGIALIGRRDLLNVIVDHHIKFEAEMSPRFFRGELDKVERGMLDAVERSANCLDLQALPLHERAPRVRRLVGTKVPRWAERFYDPVRLEQDPEGAIQDLLALDTVVIQDADEAAILWLYLPEIMARQAPLLYPVDPPTLKPRDIFDRDEHYIQQLLQLRRAPVAGSAKTPGRNDPCACGSGKKYKKCCGANHDE